MEILHAIKREKKANHDARRERRNGMVPGILYGKSIENILFEIGELELQNEVQQNGEHGLLDLDLDGQKHKTLIKEVQKDSVNHKIIHIDLEELSEENKFISEVPLVFLGENGLRGKGGILQKSKNNIKVKCKAEILPKNIKIDVSSMSFGDCVRVSDMEFGAEITVLDELDSIIASVTTASGADIPDESNLPVEDDDK